MRRIALRMKPSNDLPKRLTEGWEDANSGDCASRLPSEIFCLPILQATRTYGAASVRHTATCGSIVLATMDVDSCTTAGSFGCRLIGVRTTW